MKKFRTKRKLNIGYLLLAVMMLFVSLSYGCNTNRGEDTSEPVLKKDTAVYYVNREKTRIQGEKYVWTKIIKN